jgi:hypothetical protein
MRMKQHVVVGFVAILAGSAVLAGQSLADVAKAEEARRKTVKSPAKVYTNDDLKTGDQTTEPAPTQAAAPAQPGATPAPKPDPAAAAKEKPAPEDPKKTEKYWRDRINAAEQSVARNKVLLDALQSRVNALSTDFVNTDDPAQRAVVEKNRRAALAEMENVKSDIDKQTKEIANIQEEARKANVPPGWLR